MIRMTRNEYLKYKIEKMKNGTYSIERVEKVKDKIKHYQEILDRLEKEKYN